MHRPQAQGARTFSYHIAAVIIHPIVQGLSSPKKHLNSSSTACNITSCWLSCRSFTNSFPLSPSPTSTRLCAMTYSCSKTSISDRANKKALPEATGYVSFTTASSHIHTDFRKHTDSHIPVGTPTQAKKPYKN